MPRYKAYLKWLDDLESGEMTELMPSMYAEYVMERTDDFIKETDKGWVTWRYVNDKTVYIIDIYVKPEFRQMGYAKTLADEVAEIAKQNGYKEMIGTVMCTAKNSERSIKVLLAYGMTLKNANSDIIVLHKEL